MTDPKPLTPEEEAEVRRDLDPDDAYQYGGWAHLVSRILATLDAERAARPDGHEHHPDTRSDHAHCVDCGEAFSVDFASPEPGALAATPPLVVKFGPDFSPEQVDEARRQIESLAPPLTVERLARMLVDSGLMRRYDEYSRDAHPDTMRRVESLDSLAMDWALAMLHSAPQDAHHPDAGNPERNHYDWFMPENPTAAVNDYLDSFEAKMTEALTDPFVHDMAQSVLPLIAAYRAGRAALDAAYRERNAVVAALIRVGGYPASLVPAPDAEGWWIVYAETPQGQVSWHVGPDDLDLFDGIPAQYVAWDRHTTEEKYERVAALAAPAPAPDAERLREALRRLVDSAVLVPMDREDDDDGPAEVWVVHPDPLEEARAALAAAGGGGAGE